MNGKVETNAFAAHMSHVGNRMNRHVGSLLPLLAFALALSFSSRCLSADWTLSEAQIQRLETGAIIAEGDVATDRAAADIRAAIKVNATPEQVFRTLTDCSQALRFVPHLKRCAVIETGPGGNWQNVEQQVDYGWLVPRAHYVFHADYQKFEQISFSNLRGDFRENRGMWKFRPLADGQATLVTYEARIVPAFYVPRWMMRNMLKRDLPDLMRGLRTHAEAVRSASATGAPVPPGP
jgi:ribosome-associated toxin RatA of RatAB toxin-antitoxin module